MKAAVGWCEDDPPLQQGVEEYLHPNSDIQSNNINWDLFFQQN